MDVISEHIWPIAAGAIAIIAILIGLMVWQSISPRVRGRRGQRLGIVEYHEIDKMRRLVLIRRDQVEHLVLIGGPQDLVIESGIGATPEAPMRPAPKPPVFGTGSPKLKPADPPLITPRPRDGDL